MQLFSIGRAETTELSSPATRIAYWNTGRPKRALLYFGDALEPLGLSGSKRRCELQS